MTLLIIGHTFAYEMESLARLFLPGRKILVRGEGDTAAPDTIVTIMRINADDSVDLQVKLNMCGYRRDRTCRLPPTPAGDDAELAMARMLYELLLQYTGITPRWGILTGVRPVRLLRSIRERSGGTEAARKYMKAQYLISDEKLDLIDDIEARQRVLLEKADPKGFSLYISIPFCPSRCLYCSFVSHDIKGVSKLVPDYLRLLCQEIRRTGELAERVGLKLQTVYMGGGTPTTLSSEQLRMVMETVDQSFDLSHNLEYTVEAGRPDTITEEKLMALRECGVDRISINPQTMNDSVLLTIGRNHTAAEVEEGFHLARKAGFPCINMDLIAGLPGDTEQSFANTIRQVLDMGPENITVHTLTVKRSSDLKTYEADSCKGMDLSTAMAGGQCRLAANGYLPYYLYRQKGTVENLENVGYALPGHEGLYNVLIMEELQTILAVGAGAVSKIYRPGHPLRRVFNFKFPYEYIGRFSTVLERKSEVESIYKEQQ